MKKKKPPATSSPLDVYDFDEFNDEFQISSVKIVNKLKNIKPRKSTNYSPVTKFNFLPCFAKGTASKSKKLVEVEDDKTIKKGLPHCIGSVSSGSSNSIVDTGKKSYPVTINIDDGDRESSASTAFFKRAENEEENDVVVQPDIIFYGERYSVKCHITFTSSCIKVDCSDVCGDKGSLYIELTVGDILKIESQWCNQFKTASVNLLYKLGGKELAKDADMRRGIAKLRFAVFDPCWCKQEEAIKSLNTGYDAKWIPVSDIDANLEKNNIFISKYNFPNRDEHVKEVIYPKGHPDAVSVSMREIELLQPERFVNDTIIDFYMKYLENKIKPEEKHRFHFFNCFFFRKLVDLDKNRRGTNDSRAAFRRVHKWTRKVNLFEKDYIFIPVNFSLHWSLIVICHPGEAAKIEDEDMQKVLKVPCILHMDSIKGSHRGLKNLFQSYLWEEWKERGNQLEDVFSNFLNLQFVPLELPQQENSFDCGIFLLHYAELFLEHAPFCFNPFKKKKSPNFLNKDWFPPLEASRKRTYIKKLIDQILEDYQETSPPTCDRDEHSPEVLILEKGETGLEVSEETCTVAKTESYCSSAVSDQKSGTESLGGTPKEHDSWRISLGENCLPIRKMSLRGRLKNAMTPIEEVEETYEPSTEVEMNEKHFFNDLLGSNSSEANEKSEPPSAATAELATSVVEDSEEEDGVIYINDSEKSLFHLRKLEATSKPEDESYCILLQADGEVPILESNRKLCLKRRSPVQPERVRRHLRSSSKDLHG